MKNFILTFSAFILISPAFSQINKPNKELYVKGEVFVRVKDYATTDLTYTQGKVGQHIFKIMPIIEKYGVYQIYRPFERLNMESLKNTYQFMF